MTEHYIYGEFNDPEDNHYEFSYIKMDIEQLMLGLSLTVLRSNRIKLSGEFKRIMDVRIKVSDNFTTSPVHTTIQNLLYEEYYS